MHSILLKNPLCIEKARLGQHLTCIFSNCFQGHDYPLHQAALHLHPPCYQETRITIRLV